MPFKIIIEVIVEYFIDNGKNNHILKLQEIKQSRKMKQIELLLTMIV